MKTRLFTTAICLIMMHLSYARNNQTTPEVKTSSSQTHQLTRTQTSSSNINTSTADTVKKENVKKNYCKENNTPTILFYDFKTKTTERVPFCIFNQFVIYRIDNINRFLYNVKITADQMTYQSDAPSGISQIFNITKSETETTTNTSNAVLVSQTNDTALADSIKECSSLKVQLINNKEILSAVKEIQVKINDSLLNGNKEITILGKNNEIKIRIGRIDSFINSQGQSSNLKLLQQLHSSIIKLFRSYNHLEKAKHINNELVSFSMRDIDYNTSLERVKSIEKSFPSIKRPEQILSDFNNYYLEFTKSLRLYNEFLDRRINDNNSKQKKDSILKEIQKDKQTKENLNSIFSEIKDLKDNVESFDFIGLFSSLNNILFELKKENNFFVVSDPVQANKDAVNFKIDISPISKVSSASNLDQRNFSTTIPVIGGFKIDFSTGIFLTSGLHNRQYSTSTVSKDSSIITMNRNNNLMNISIGALMHISKRCNNDFKIGGSIGSGLGSSDLTNLNFFVGPCLIIGKQEQFIISLGGAITQVDYLKSKYSLNTPIGNSKMDQTLTEKATRFGYFISFTYNLTSNKKE